MLVFNAGEGIMNVFVADSGVQQGLFLGGRVVLALVCT
jgi:hypothetical protein